MLADNSSDNTAVFLPQLEQHLEASVALEHTLMAIIMQIGPRQG